MGCNSQAHRSARLGHPNLQGAGDRAPPACLTPARLPRRARVLHPSGFHHVLCLSPVPVPQAEEAPVRWAGGGVTSPGRFQLLQLPSPPPPHCFHPGASEGQSSRAHSAPGQLHKANCRGSEKKTKSPSSAGARCLTWHQRQEMPPRALGLDLRGVWVEESTFKSLGRKESKNQDRHTNARLFQVCVQRTVPVLRDLQVPGKQGHAQLPGHACGAHHAPRNPRMNA